VKQQHQQSEGGNRQREGKYCAQCRDDCFHG
jgi:hypothetical protein